MATFDLRTLLNDLYAESVPVGGTQTNSVQTADLIGNNPLADNFLAKGAHTITLASGDRVITGDVFALAAGNPEVANGYLGSDTFSFTLNINGVLSSIGTTIDLQNSRGTSANTVTVGKDGVIGGDDGAIYAEAKTNITNNGLITSFFDDGSGTAIELNGWAGGSNINAASTTTITNNAGAIIMGGAHAILHESLGALTVVNRGIIVGSETDSETQGSGGAVYTWDGKLTLTNEVGGYVDGTIRAGWLGSSITNKGEIEGTIRASMYGEVDINDNLTGWIDFDRDGTPSGSDPGDKHWNTLGSTIAFTITNTGHIDGTNNWFNNGVDNSENVEVALDLSHGKDVVTNSGIISGNVRTRTGNDSVTNNALSTIDGDVKLGSDIFFAAYLGGKYGLDDDTLVNKGLITGGVFTEMGKDIITNNGEIQGDVQIGTGNYDAANAKDEDYDTITNTGLIGGNVWTGLGDDIVTNSGRINDGLDTSAWPGFFDGSQWNWENETLVAANKDLDNDKDTVTNTGVINGGVYTGHGADKVTNSNLIEGPLETGTYNWIGDPDNGNPYTVVDLSKFQADDNDTVDNKGTVTDYIWTGLGADTVTNSGFTTGIYTTDNDRTKIVDEGGPNETTLNIVIPVDAAIFDNDTVTNSGTVVDEIWTGVGNDVIKNLATGKVTNGGIYAGDGKDTIENLGFVAGNVDLGNGDALESKITNGGTIKGNVYLGINGVNKLINNKMIEGSVSGDDGVAADGSNTIENAGVILGDIMLGLGTDVVTNKATGRIDGNINLGAGNDKYFGNVTSETIFDEAGNDEYKMGGGNDDVIFASSGIQNGVGNTFDGELGTDSIEFSIVGTGTDATVNLSVTTAQSLIFSGIGFSQTNTLKNFENVYAGSGNDTIVGSIATNDIQGGDGNDKITGGKGQDFLEGGSGDDSFIYTLVDDSLAGTSDIIFDFGDGYDNIDLAFAGTVTESNTFTAASLSAVQWRYSQVGGNTVVEVNADADLAADMVIYLSGYVGLGQDGDLITVLAV